MVKNFQTLIYCALLAGLLMLPTVVRSQDLGSSSGLFNNPKTKAASKKAAPRKAAAPKPKKVVAAVKKAAPKPVARVVRKPNKPKAPKKTNVELANIETALLPPPASETAVIIPVSDKPTVNAEELYEKAIEEGNAARDQRQYTRAEAAYLRAQDVKIKDSRHVHGLGNLYSDQQRWEEAERAYRAAIEIDPNAPETHIALSFVLTQPITGENLPTRYTAAEKFARRAVELDPKNAFAYDQLGVALELSGKISEETQGAYRKAIELEPKFALAYAHLGRLLRRLGAVGDSTAAYRSAIEFSTDVPTMILVADVMQSQQKYQESEQLLRLALKDDDRNPTALFLLGRALTTRGSYEEAETVLKKSAEVSPNSFVSYVLLGSMFMRREKYEDAEQYLLKAVDVVSPNEKRRLAQEFEAVGDGFLRVGKNTDAVRVYRQAVALDKERTALAGKLTKAEAN